METVRKWAHSYYKTIFEKKCCIFYKTIDIFEMI